MGAKKNKIHQINIIHIHTTINYYYRVFFEIHNRNSYYHEHYRRVNRVIVTIELF